MTNAEKAGFEAYPENISYSTIGDVMYDYNAEKRRVYVAGYEQGYKDGIDKAYKWLSEQMFELHVELNACEEIYVADGQASSLEEFLINFKQAMEE